MPSPDAFAPLLDSSHFAIFFLISTLVVFAYTLTILFSTTSLAGKFDKKIKKANKLGPYIIRLAISASFFYAALSNCVFGPELSLNVFSIGWLIRFLLFIIALMIFFGVYVEIAALIGIIIFITLCFHFGLYMVTYANYLGELIVLFMFGSRVLSFDKLFFGNKLFISAFEKYQDLEIPLVRILYGIALLYAGYTIKFQHQSLSILVYNEYHLQNFFHASAKFIAAGAGLSEILIGFFIIIGFSQRLTILISLVFITLSVLYFKELIWPHLMLYGISFSLLINSADKFTLENYLIPKLRLLRKRIF